MMRPKTRSTDGHGRRRSRLSDVGLTPGVLETLASLALMSEESADIGEALSQLERRLAAQEIGDTALNDAARILGSNLTRWRVAHEMLARYSMRFAQLYEDERCGTTE